jgi:hypothetical protein
MSAFSFARCFPQVLLVSTLSLVACGALDSSSGGGGSTRNDDYDDSGSGGSGGSGSGSGSGSGGGGGGGGGGSSSVDYAEAYVLCDPDADSFDDIVYVFLYSEPNVEGVTAFWNYDWYQFDLTYEPSTGYWEAGMWADDLDTDCDRIGEHGAYIEGYMSGTVATEGWVVMERAR